jgi:hypothetical protein
MPSKQKRTVQTTLKPASKDDEAWKTIGRAKRREQASCPDQGKTEAHKKTDTKKTPPRECEKIVNFNQKMSTDPLLTTSSSSFDSSKAECNLISIIAKNINSVSASEPSSILSTILDSVECPPLPPKIKLLTDNLSHPKKIIPSIAEDMEIVEDENLLAQFRTIAP